MSEGKTLTVRVPKEWKPPAWLKTAAATEVAALIDIASQLREIVPTACQDVDQTAMKHMLDGAMTVEREHSTRLDLEKKEIAEKLHDMSVELHRVQSSRDTAIQRAVETERNATLQSNIERSQLEFKLGALQERLDDEAKRGEARAFAAHVEECRQLQNRTRELEERLFRSMTSHKDDCDRLGSENLTLKGRIAALETPAGKGRAGEGNVADLLADAGFTICDTSNGGYKERGYLDLLVTPHDTSPGDVETAGLRIAIEIKNRKTIEAAHLRDFDAKVTSGILNNMWDAAIFLSIRAPTKKARDGTPVVLDMMADRGGKPLVPVSYIGTEQRSTASLLDTEIEMHIMTMAAVATQCSKLRTELSHATDADQEKKLVQNMVHDTSQHMLGCFEDLARQQRLVSDLSASVASSRAHCLNALTCLFREDPCLPWLEPRSAGVEWMNTVLQLRQKFAGGVRPPKIWADAHRNHKLIERYVGKESMFLAFKRERDGTIKGDATDVSSTIQAGE